MKKSIFSILLAALLTGALSVSAAAQEPILISPKPTIVPVVTPVVPSEDVPLAFTGPVAMIGDNEYDSLADAVADVEIGGEILLLGVPVDGEDIVVDRPVSFTLVYNREILLNPKSPGSFEFSAGGEVQMMVSGMSYDDGTNVEAYTFYDCELYYEANGGTSITGKPRTDGAISGKPYRLLGKFTYTAPEGYTFRAWEIDGVEYQPMYWYTFEEDTTITAVWETIEEASVRTAIETLTAAVSKSDADTGEVQQELTSMLEALMAKAANA